MPASNTPLKDSPASRALARRTGRRLRQAMVNWFSPALLLRTLLVSLTARVFGRYADRRDSLRALPPDGPFRYDDQNELWLDYVADLGDGWDATTTVASLIAAPQLTVDEQVLPHARVLVMGGDQVYPVASRDEYLRRLEAPYYSVLPFSPEQAPRDLFVLPGNHDWYDGLAAFSALFMQQRWFAGWRTRQSRSYFVLRLPQRWWFIAADIQLDNDIDAAQRDYLLHATADIAPGDRVVLASAEPFWLAPQDNIARRNMAYLERKLVEERGAKVWVSLAGDLHHYQRHAQEDGAQRIVSGGGGAFMHGTAWQTETPAAAFPSPLASRLALWRLLCFPLFNPGFAYFLGGLLVLLLWAMDSAGNGLLFGNIGLGAPIGPMLVAQTLPASPWLTGLLIGWFAVFVAFVEAPAHWSATQAAMVRVPLGMLHGAVHLAIGMSVLAWWLPSRLDEPLLYIVTMLELSLLYALLCGFCFGLYLFVTYQFFGFHRETVFAACRIADWKNFLRLHIAADGTLTIHALGIPRICRRWRERQPKVQGEAFVEPADGVALSRRVVLVERVVIAPE